MTTRHDASAYAGLHVLADDDPRWPLGPVAQAEAACRGGARVVQLRAKQATDARVVEWGRSIRALTRKAGVCFVVNDRFDLALLVDADAVHLGQDDLPPAAIPRSARERLAVGRSTHTLAQARAALSEEVDYVAFGPLFGTQSKDAGYSARGLDALREVVVAAADRPVVAIGGIDADNAGDVAKTGARGIAVISSIVAASNPVAATRTIVERFDTGGAR